MAADFPGADHGANTHQGRPLPIRCAPRIGTCAEDLRQISLDAALPGADRPRALERGGCWIPLGDLDLGLGYENQTSYPAPGEIILYPGGISETEILLAYGGVRFASKVGQLAGNHFLTVIEGVDQLRPLGKCVLWEGAQDILFEAL